MADWSPQIKSLLSSPLGIEIIRTLTEDLRLSIIEDAEKASTPDEAFGLLKEARGVIRVVEQLSSIAALSSIDEGSEVKK